MTRYYATVSLSVSVELDLHGAEPTVNNLAVIGQSQVGKVAAEFSKRFGGCSFGVPMLTSIRIDCEQKDGIDNG